MKNRMPVVAGRFYSSDPQKLKTEMASYFSAIPENKPLNQLRAIVAPHAGYVYSGYTAACAFASIDPEKSYKNIFVIAPSHHVAFQGASIYNIGDYITPLGNVKVNIDVASQLIQETTCFSFYEQAHLQEHSVEVQLPFLQYCLKKPFQLIPIVIGTSDIGILHEIATALHPYFNDENLFVFSSDFSHYPSANDAELADHRIAEALLTRDMIAIDQVVRENNRVNELVTSACGLAGLKVLVILCLKNHCEMKTLNYTNSGSFGYKDKNRVVGYWALAAFINAVNDEQLLTNSDKQLLLTLARIAIQHGNISWDESDESQFPDSLKQELGAFVSVYVDNELRGCIGRFSVDKPLFKIVQEMALQSAFADHRFKELSKDEIQRIAIEISVLSPLKPIQNINEIELGKHGIYIKKGGMSGTFLPQVASKTGWTLEEFLGNCARNKAGIGWYGWRDAELYIYTADIFSDKD